MRIAIIGCGLVGIDTAIQLRRAGHRVTGTTTRESRVPEIEEFLDEVVVLRGTDEDKVADLLGRNDVVIVSVSGGMFAESGRGTVRSEELYKSIYIDTAETIARVLEHNDTIKQVIYTSAETVYSGIKEGPITEDTPLLDSVDKPTQAFIDTERIFEKMRTPNRAVCMLRLAIVYGKRFSMELMIELAKKGPVPFSGDSILTFVHVRDVARALTHAVTANLNGTYNCDASPDYFAEIGHPVTNQEYFDEVGARENPPVRTTWLGLVKGWAEISNAKLRETGFTFTITNPDFREPEFADSAEAVRRLCVPMVDQETGTFVHRGFRLSFGDESMEALLGVPFCQELYLRSPETGEEKMMNRLVGVMQKGANQKELLMHYYATSAPEAFAERLAKGDRDLRPNELGELMYTMTLGYDVDEDCYRGNQRYPVKLHHLIGMMPEEVFQKIFAQKETGNGSPPEPEVAAEAPPMAMPGAEWHILELYPDHVKYMHAFLSNINDEKPMPGMGMQQPFTFIYS